jgi:serine protease Do
MKKHLIILSIILLAVLNILSLVAWQRVQNKQTQDFNQKISLLQKQISTLTEKFAQKTGEDTSSAVSLQEIANRQIVREKSQDQLLTEAVAKVGPSVVSIVITKDVPQMEVTYQNPFGDDPFFKDFNFRVPVYKQKGTIKQKVGGGTGFLISQDGYILTNRHVVSDEGAEYTVLLTNGSQKPAKIIYKDQQNDIAIIKIEGKNFSAVSLGDSDNLKLGQTVVAIGNALAQYNNSVSIGIVSGLNRTITAGQPGSDSETLKNVIQTDAAINPGNSGGPLFGLDGQVIGVNVATVQGSSNISFSIPINQVKSIIKSVIVR